MEKGTTYFILLEHAMGRTGSGPEAFLEYHPPTTLWMIRLLGWKIWFLYQKLKSASYHPL